MPRIALESSRREKRFQRRAFTTCGVVLLVLAIYFQRGCFVSLYSGVRNELLWGDTDWVSSDGVVVVSGGHGYAEVSSRAFVRAPELLVEECRHSDLARHFEFSERRRRDTDLKLVRRLLVVDSAGRVSDVIEVDHVIVPGRIPDQSPFIVPSKIIEVPVRGALSLQLVLYYGDEDGSGGWTSFPSDLSREDEAAGLFGQDALLGSRELEPFFQPPSRAEPSSTPRGETE